MTNVEEHYFTMLNFWNISLLHCDVTLLTEIMVIHDMWVETGNTMAHLSFQDKLYLSDNKLMTIKTQSPPPASVSMDKKKPLHFTMICKHFKIKQLLLKRTGVRKVKRKKGGEIGRDGNKGRGKVG